MYRHKKFLKILYAKYKNSDLHKFMETQFQYFTITHCNELLKLLHKFEEFVEFTFCVCCNLYGLIKTEMCINTLLSSLLDR